MEGDSGNVGAKKYIEGCAAVDEDDDDDAVVAERQTRMSCSRWPLSCDIQ